MWCLVTSLFGNSVALLEVNSARLDELCFRMATGLSVDEQLSAVPRLQHSSFNAPLFQAPDSGQVVLGFRIHRVSF